MKHYVLYAISEHGEGHIQTSVDWAEELGISVDLINNRLNRGYNEEEALYG